MTHDVGKAFEMARVVGDTLSVPMCSLEVWTFESVVNGLENPFPFAGGLEGIPCLSWMALK